MGVFLLSDDGRQHRKGLGGLYFMLSEILLLLLYLLFSDLVFFLSGYALCFVLPTKIQRQKSSSSSPQKNNTNILSSFLNHIVYFPQGLLNISIFILLITL